MPIDHSSKKGDCLSSIAFRYGFFPETVWLDGANVELKKKRVDPNCLAPGDLVVIPDKRMGEESVSTETRARFRRKGVPAKFSLRLLEDGKPRQNVAYRLYIGTSSKEDTTKVDGMIELSFSPAETTGTLYLGPANDEQKYILNLGHVQPHDSIAGVQSRLTNLGFDCGEVTGEMNEETEEAIEAFQIWAGHSDPNGQMDKQTMELLAKLHQSKN